MRTLTAGQIMNRDVITVSPDTLLRQAAELMEKRHISGMPVVEADGTVVGMISEADILDQSKREAALPRIALFGVYVPPQETLNRVYQEGLALQVRQLMTTHLVTADEEMPVSELSALMVRHRINRIPILRDGKLVGIVTRHDLLQALTDSVSDKR